MGDLTYDLPGELRVEADGPVRTVVIDRPDELNAVNAPLHRALAVVWRQLAADREARVVVLTGAGRAFSAGGDLGWITSFLDDPVARDESLREGAEIVDELLRFPLPVIAAVNGPAVGIGATVTLPMDVRIAAESARFGFVFARRGITMEACSSWFLPRLPDFNEKHPAIDLRMETTSALVNFLLLFARRKQARVALLEVQNASLAGIGNAGKIAVAIQSQRRIRLGHSSKMAEARPQKTFQKRRRSWSQMASPAPSWERNSATSSSGPCKSAPSSPTVCPFQKLAEDRSALPACQSAAVTSVRRVVTARS